MAATATGALRTVVRRYLTVVCRYGRLPFRLPLAAFLLFGPVALAFEAALLLRVEAGLGATPPVPVVAVGVSAAVVLYAVEYAVICRLAERVDA